MTRIAPRLRGLMCERCDEIGRRVWRYQELAKHTTDKAALEGIMRLITKLEADKLALHPLPDE